MTGLVLQGQSITEPRCFHWKLCSEQSSCTNKLEGFQPAPRRKTKTRNQLKPCSHEWQETAITGELDTETRTEIKDIFGMRVPQNIGDRGLQGDVEGGCGREVGRLFKDSRRPLFSSIALSSGLSSRQALGFDTSSGCTNRWCKTVIHSRAWIRIDCDFFNQNKCQNYTFCPGKALSKQPHKGELLSCHCRPYWDRLCRSFSLAIKYVNWSACDEPLGLLIGAELIQGYLVAELICLPFHGRSTADHGAPGWIICKVLSGGLGPEKGMTDWFVISIGLGHCLPSGSQTGLMYRFLGVISTKYPFTKHLWE